jgi:hypothetical protein
VLLFHRNRGHERSGGHARNRTHLVEDVILRSCDTLRFLNLCRRNRNPNGLGDTLAPLIGPFLYGFVPLPYSASRLNRFLYKIVGSQMEHVSGAAIECTAH